MRCEFRRTEGACGAFAIHRAIEEPAEQLEARLPLRV